MEDEEEALARALELSRLEQENGQKASGDQPLLSRQPAHEDLVRVTILEYMTTFFLNHLLLFFLIKKVPNILW